MTADQILRRECLADLLKAAETCPIYARQAARDYERIATAHGCPAMLKGLADKFDIEWSAANAKR